LQYEEFAGCLVWWNDRKENGRAWKVSADEILKYDEAGNLISVNLDIKNPNSRQDFEHLPPEQLADHILKKEQRIFEIITEIKLALEKGW
jgi:type I restriction enzyme M protein